MEIVAPSSEIVWVSEVFFFRVDNLPANRGRVPETTAEGIKWKQYSQAITGDIRAHLQE